VKVREAAAAVQEEAQKLVDVDEAVSQPSSGWRTRDHLLDELDKIAGREEPTDPTFPGKVQRDLLPIVEGSTVTTKYGMVRTDHILFIAAGVPRGEPSI